MEYDIWNMEHGFLTNRLKEPLTHFLPSLFCLLISPPLAYHSRVDREWQSITKLTGILNGTIHTSNAERVDSRNPALGPGRDVDQRDHRRRNLRAAVKSACAGRVL